MTKGSFINKSDGSSSFTKVYLLVGGPQAQDQLHGAEPSLSIARQKRKGVHDHHCRRLDLPLSNVCERNMLYLCHTLKLALLR